MSIAPTVHHDTIGVIQGMRKLPCRADKLIGSRARGYETDRRVGG